jgi:hypothetical protein
VCVVEREGERERKRERERERVCVRLCVDEKTRAPSGQKTAIGSSHRCLLLQEELRRVTLAGRTTRSASRNDQRDEVALHDGSAEED